MEKSILSHKKYRIHIYSHPNLSTNKKEISILIDQLNFPILRLFPLEFYITPSSSSL